MGYCAYFVSASNPEVGCKCAAITPMFQVSWSPVTVLWPRGRLTSSETTSSELPPPQSFHPAPGAPHPPGPSAWSTPRTATSPENLPTPFTEHTSKLSNLGAATNLVLAPADVTIWQLWLRRGETQVKSMSCNKQSSPRSGTSVPRANTIHLKQQAEAFVQQVYLYDQTLGCWWKTLSLQSPSPNTAVKSKQNGEQSHVTMQ